MNSRQPNSRHCFVCGVENPFGLKLRFDQDNSGEVIAECCLDPEYQGYPGVAHGGVVAAMLDEITARSHMSANPPRFMFTARLDIRYRQNVPIGEPLRLIGRAGSIKGRAAKAHGEIIDSEGNLLAEADALLVNMPPDTLLSIDLEALGWRVYDEDAGS